MRIEVLNTRDRRVQEDAARLARKLAREYKLARTTVNLVLVGDREMRRMNRRFRKRGRTTDVLAFPVDERDPSSRTRLLGEVYVSRERARVQGREYGTGYHGEVRRLALHGILHLLGLEHREMEEVYARFLEER